MTARLVFRGLRAEHHTTYDFTSNKGRGDPPRGAELRDPEEYDSLSMWETRELLEPWCVKYPKIGRYIAELEIPDDLDEPGGPFRMWPSGPDGHWSVQGEPEAFLPFVRRIYRVGETAPIWEAPGASVALESPGVEETEE